MNVTLECPACNKPLEVDTAWANQQVDCPLCGNPFTVPAFAPPPVARMLPPPIPQASAIQLWSPNAAVNWSILFGPVFGSILHYLNWRNLGEEKQAKTALTWVVLAIAWTVVIGVFTTVWPQSPLPWPLTILFLVVWYLSAGKKQIDFVKERFASSYERRSWLAPIGLTVLILMGLGALSLLEVPPEPSQPALPLPGDVPISSDQSPQMQGLQVPSAQAIFQLTGEEALQAARKFMVGTWTYTGPNYTFFAFEGGESPEGRGVRAKQKHGWVKWVVRDDGTMLKYRAPVVADDWGMPETANWNVTTGKFQNTGDRYYRFVAETEAGSYQDSVEKLGGSAVLIKADGTLEYRVYSDLIIVMERGDKLPFSK